MISSKESDGGPHCLGKVPETENGKKKKKLPVQTPMGWTATKKGCLPRKKLEINLTKRHKGRQLHGFKDKAKVPRSCGVISRNQIEVSKKSLNVRLRGQKLLKEDRDGRE